MMLSESKSLWVQYVISFTSIVVCYSSFLLEIKTRVSNSWYSLISLSGANKYQKMLNIWSLSTLFVCTARVTVLLLSGVSPVCRYVNQRYFPLLIIIKVLFTFYQIARLHYCFQQMHYLKYIITLLYGNGMLIIVYYFIFHLKSYKLINPTFCIILRDIHILPYFLSFGYICYYIWDLTIVSVYIWKVNSLNPNN
eukprot:99638_1